MYLSHVAWRNPHCILGTLKHGGSAIRARTSRLWRSVFVHMLVILALQPCVCACAFQFGPSVEALGLAIAFDNLAWVLWLALHSALPATCPRKHCDDKVFLRRSCLYVLSYGARRMIAGPRHAWVILCHARLSVVRGDCLCRRFAPLICRVSKRILVGRQFDSFGLGAFLLGLAPTCQTMSM